MSGAQSWSVKGIDPKVREAAREAAARQGMSLGEYLNQALAAATCAAGATPPAPPQHAAAHARVAQLGFSTMTMTKTIGALRRPTPMPRGADPQRLAQRIESIERRTQLAVTGLDRAVSTIDRSVLGLAARVEDAEAVSSESADRIAEALDHFRVAGDTLGGRLERAEQDVAMSRDALVNAASTHRDQSELVARRSGWKRKSRSPKKSRAAPKRRRLPRHRTENRDARSITSSAHCRRRTPTLAEARAAAEEAARQAAEASADAVTELRRLQEHLSERLADTEALHAPRGRNRDRGSAHRDAQETRGAREALLEEVVRLESEIAKRVGAVDQLKAEQADADRAHRARGSWRARKHGGPAPSRGRGDRRSAQRAAHACGAREAGRRYRRQSGRARSQRRAPSAARHRRAPRRA